MKYNVFILILFVFLTSCSNQLSDYYSSKPWNHFQKTWFYYTKSYSSYAVGIELRLNQDSLFNLTTCSTIATGSWYSSKDSLFLVYKTHEWRSDSLQNVGIDGKWPYIPKEPITIKIRRKKLLWQTIDTIDGKAYKSLNILKKN